MTSHTAPMISRLSRYEIGGSDGARTRSHCNAGLAKTAPLSQGVSQDSGVAPELLEIVTAWHDLTEPIKAAVLAVVRSAQGGKL